MMIHRIRIQLSLNQYISFLVRNYYFDLYQLKNEIKRLNKSGIEIGMCFFEMRSSYHL